MSFWGQVGDFMLGRWDGPGFGLPMQRGSGPALDSIPQVGRFFGPGAGHQPNHDVLLRESVGLPNALTEAIANRIASLELQVMTSRRVEDGTVEDEILDTHPLKELLDNPHPTWTTEDIMGLTAQWLVTVGEAYYLKIGSGFGVPIELHPFPPAMIEPHVRLGVVEGYVITDGDGKRHERAADEVVRIYLPDPQNPWRSKGIFGPAALTADAHKFASEHLRAHYQHDATPKITLEADKEASLPDPTQRARFAEDWSSTYHARTAGRIKGTPRMLPPGWKAHELDAGAGESTNGYMGTWRDDLMLMWGVPRSVLGQVVSGDRSSAETNQWVFDRYRIAPIAARITGALTKQLASDFDGDVWVRHAPFVSEDKEFNQVQEQQDVEHGIRTINDVLKARGVDAVPWGDDPLMLSKLGKYDPNARPGLPPMGVVDVDGDDGEEDEEDEERMARDLHVQIRKLERAAKRRRRKSAA